MTTRAKQCHRDGYAARRYRAVRRVVGLSVRAAENAQLARGWSIRMVFATGRRSRSRRPYLYCYCVGHSSPVSRRASTRTRLYMRAASRRAAVGDLPAAGYSLVRPRMIHRNERYVVDGSDRPYRRLGAVRNGLGPSVGPQRRSGFPVRGVPVGPRSYSGKWGRSRSDALPIRHLR